MKGYKERTRWQKKSVKSLRVSQGWSKGKGMMTEYRGGAEGLTVRLGRGGWVTLPA